MRKFLVGSLLVAAAGGGAVLSGSVLAGASPTCFPGGQPAGSPVTVSATQSGTAGVVQVCISGTGVADGTVTAAGDPTTQQGYIVADGNDSNHGALSGYIGVSSADNGVVGCSNGDFNNEAYTGVPSSGDSDSSTSPEGTSDSDANNQILPLPTDPNFQNDLAKDLAALQANSGPCAVPAPAPTPSVP